MVNVDFVGLGSFFALLLGVLMFAGGMYARRGGKLRSRQGAAILAGFAAAIGVMVFGVGLYAMVAA